MLNIGDSYNNKYIVVSHLGKGGMARVLLVRDQQLGSLWALKETSKVKHPKETELQRQKRVSDVLSEAKLLSIVRNPNIPRVADIHETEDYIYILQDYVEGVTLREKLDSTQKIKIKRYLEKHPDVTLDTLNNKFIFRQMSKSDFLNISRKVASIMKYLHTLNPPIIYRDLKPENLMIDESNNIKLIDFGIAYQLTPELSKPGAKQAMGTWGYAAPEQIGHGANPTTQTDIYNYGKMLYELLSGIIPTTRKNKKLIELPPIREVRPDIDEGIEYIINKCTKKDPEERYKDFTEVLYDLEHYRELGSTYRDKLKSRLKKVILLGVLSLVAFTTAGVKTTLDNIYKHRAYESMISQADMYTNVQDLIPVIQDHPKETRPVERLVELYTKDNKFTPDEEQEFINLLSPNMAYLKENSDYGNLAYKIGQMYLFYYDVSSEQDFNYQMRLSQSTQWFKDAVTYKADDKDTAEVFYKLGVFNRDISTAQSQFSDKGMYKNYFNNLKSLLDQYDNKNVTNYAKIQISNIICNTIKQYHTHLLEDGVSKKNMISLLDKSRVKFDKLDVGKSQSALNLKDSTSSLYDTTYNFLK